MPDDWTGPFVVEKKEDMSFFWYCCRVSKDRVIDHLTQEEAEYLAWSLTNSKSIEIHGRIIVDT